MLRRRLPGPAICDAGCKDGSVLYLPQCHRTLEESYQGSPTRSFLFGVIRKLFSASTCAFNATFQ